jgi:hypothetical protein
MTKLKQPDWTGAKCITPISNQTRVPQTDYSEERKPTVIEAAKMCLGCPIQKMCYDYAVKNNESSLVWGGVLFEVKSQTSKGIVGGPRI